jgi:HEAT repeat protein
MRTVLLVLLLPSVLPGAAPAEPIAPTFAGKPLSHWVGLLKDDNPLLREEAVAVLGEMGEAAREALPVLRPLLKSTDPRLRARATVAVWKIERQSKDVLPVVLDILRGPDREPRLLALQVLDQMGTAALPAAPALVALLDDNEAQIRGRASTALRQLGVDAIPSLTTGLKERGPDGRHGCIQLLHPFSTANPKVADALAERLKDEDKRIRLDAARALLLSVPHRKAVVAEFAQAVKDSEVAHRRAAVESVFTVSPRPREMLEVFGALLDDPDAQVAANAAQAVWELSKDAKRVVPTLNRILQDDDGFKPYMVMTTLRQMGPEARPCLPGLLRGPSVYTPALGDIVRQIGPAALPEVLDATAATNTSAVRRKAVEVLGNAGPDSLPHLQRLMGDKNLAIREAAVRSVGAIGPKAKEALPALMQFARDDNANFRTAAIQSLGKLGPEAKPAAELLLTALKDMDVGVRYAAVTALSQVPLDPRTALPAIDAEIKDDKVAYVRFQAILLRLKLDADPTPVLPFLGEMLNDVGSQQQVIRILGEQGPKARPALPQLMALVQSGKPVVPSHLELITALVQIDPEGKTIAAALLTLVRDRDRAVRLSAFSHLARMGQECDVTPLLPELRTNDLAARQTLHRAMRQLGPRAKGATSSLLEIVRGPDVPFRLDAAETLCKVAPEHRNVGKQVLLDALGEGDKVRFDVARALLAVDEKNERVLKLFEDALKGDDPRRGFAALSALTQADASARGVLPFLTPYLKDREPGIRIPAARAHWKISGETDTAVAVLSALLQDKEGKPWHYTVVSYLGDIGPGAKAAVPGLTAILKERPPRLRAEVIAALHKIDPEAAKTAEAP